MNAREKYKENLLALVVMLPVEGRGGYPGGHGNSLVSTGLFERQALSASSYRFKMRAFILQIQLIKSILIKVKICVLFNATCRIRDSIQSQQ